MRTSVANYLNDYENFHLFGLSHWIAIVVFLFLVIWLPWYSKNYLNINQQNKIGYALGIIVFIN